MLFEMIKNATHSVVTHHGPDEAQNHPITVTIVHGPRDLTVRVSDEGAPRSRRFNKARTDLTYLSKLSMSSGGGLTPYGGLPPPPTPPSLTLLPPNASPVIPKESAQRLDIFSFSHMRRYYQHHAAQQFDSLSPSTLSSSTGAVSGKDMGPTPTPKQLTGIMALRTVGKLAGTVKEQLEAERAREGEEASEEDERLRDAQMKSGIGLPLARMFAE